MSLPRDLFTLHERPELASPVLVMVLEGWIDAGLGGQKACSVMVEGADAVTVASFDADELLDHRARRPSMELVDGVHQGLTWPSIEMRASTDRDGRGYLLLTGAEPDHRWGAFSEAVVDLALEMGCRLVVGLGAYPAAAPHTRSTGLVTTSTTAELAQQVGFVHGRVVVPAGVQAAIEERCSVVGLAAVGLWAQVPHYAAAMPYPDAALALLAGLEHVGGLVFDIGSLRKESRETRRRIDELVTNSDEHRELVAQLEAQADAMAEAQNPNLPSGEELAEELERFLRDQGTE